jgi:tripartite-type tricarboxylate transporter receptor subunit TctC
MTLSLTRRRSLLALGSLLAAPAIVRADPALPERTLRLLVGFVYGGGADTVARIVARGLERRIGRHVVVENRPGNEGATAGELLRTGAPDGTAMALLASNSLAASLKVKAFPFDPLADLAPVSLAGSFPLAFAVSPATGVESFADYLDWLKAGDAARRRLGNTSSDTFIDVLQHTINHALDCTMQIVPYRGAAPMVNDLADGRLPAAVTAATSFLPHHRGGRLQMILTSGRQRMRAAPKVPTARELGMPSLEMEEWYGFFAAPATPTPILEAWNRHLGAVLSDPDVAAEMAQLGLTAEPSSPTELHDRLAAHLKAWRVRMQEAGMTATN